MEQKTKRDNIFQLTALAQTKMMLTNNKIAKQKTKLDVDFILFEHLIQLFVEQKTKKAQSHLEAAAQQWFYKVMPKDRKQANTYYSGGSLIFNITGYGDYHYRHIILLIHFFYVGTKEFKEGRNYFLHTEKAGCDNHETDNPYEVANFYARAAWVSGFWYGFHNFYNNFLLV